MNRTITKKSALILSVGMGLGLAAAATTPAAAAGTGFTVNQLSAYGNLTSATDPTGPGESVSLFPLSDAEGNTLLAYCVEFLVGSDEGVSGYQETSASTIRNLDKVQGVLNAGYPRLSLAALQNSIPTLSASEAVLATQAAIWHYTDNQAVVPGNMVVDGEIGSQADRDVEALYNQLVAAPSASTGTVYAAKGYQTLVAALVNGRPPMAAAAINPSLSTTAVDKADKDKVLSAAGGTITDTVAYRGLVAGTTYTMTGKLMIKDATGKAIDSGITATKQFTPTAATGSMSLDFTVPASLAGKTLVAFETATTATGAVVARHADITSAPQTVTVAKPAARPAAKPVAATKTITFRVQYDRMTIKNAAQVRALAKTMTGRYSYRADVAWNARTGKVASAPLWAKGVSTWKIQTLKVTVPANASAAQIIAAEKALAASTNKVTLGKGAVGRIGHTTTAAYLIPAGAWDNTTTWKKGPRSAAQILVGATTR